MDILLKLFYILIFPGFLFCFWAGLLLAGIDRKIVARMQRRIGPPILQPFYDFCKLLGKETIVPRAAAKKTFLAAPVVGLISLITIMLFIPISGFSAFSSVADIIVILYLLTIPGVAIIIGGASSGSPFAGVGLSREMVAMLSYELPLVIVLLTIGKRVGMDTGSISFSFSQITSYQAVNGPLIIHWSMIPAAIAMLLIIPCEIGSHPFDIAEAETEICEGTLVEYSGAPLAIFKLNYAIKMLVMTALFVTLFLGGIFVNGTGAGVVAINTVILIALCIVVTIIAVTLLRAVTARLKVEQVFKFYWTVVTGLALISLVLVWFGL